MKMNFIKRALLLLLFCCTSAVAQPSLSTLGITSSNGVSTVLWPLTSSNYILQATTDLSPNATWTNLVSGSQAVSLNTFPAMGGTALYTTNKIGNQYAFSSPVAPDQQFFRLSASNEIPASCFAVFYNGLLEFSTSPPMQVNGRVHANGPIYVGSAASLVFNAPVTTTSTISSPAANGQGPWVATNWNVSFNGTPNYITNISGLGIPPLDPTNYHFLIDIPPASEDPMSPTGQLRLFNQAQMIVIVTNNSAGNGNPTVTLILQRSANGVVPGDDLAKIFLVLTNASPANLSTNLPFLTLTNSFYDQRELKTNIITDIDVGRFAAWSANNNIVQGKLFSGSGIYPTILYAADRRTSTATQPGQLSVIRLVNGVQLPFNGGLGFSFVTPNPLYVDGNYNTKIAGSAGSSAATTNTAYTVPAALLSDSLTILASTWIDAASRTKSNKYFGGSVAFAAADTTINAAIITGTVPSTGTSSSTFSGGVHNLPRLLQDWTGKNLYLNTSIIRLWDSNQATHQFADPDAYYNPPARYFNFDVNFLNPAKIPPGIPLLQVLP